MLFRISKYSVKNILRNKFLSLSSILVLTLLMFFINILFVLNDISTKLIDTVNSKLTISLYLDDDYDKTSIEVIDLIEDIKKIGGTIGVDYKTKEEILEDMRLREPDLAKILERENPLPDTIILSDIELVEYNKINPIIENKLFILSQDDKGADHFSNYTQQYKKIEQIIRVLNIMHIGLYAIIGIFVLSIFVIVYSIIGNFIYYFKDEIYITRLVGGSKKFIYGPFVLQGAFYSFASFILSTFIFIFILKSVNTAFGDIHLLESNVSLLFFEMIIFVCVGGLSGFFSSIKYLK